MKLLEVEVGEPFLARNLLVYPLYRRGGVRFATLETAQVEVLETRRINEVRLRYAGDEPLFLLDGEGLVGAWQNRVVNTAAVLRRGEHLLPASCVERGRWGGGEEFGFGDMAFPSLRAVLASTVARSLRAGKGHNADQSLVWSTVEASLRSLRVSSATQSMHDAYSTLRRAIDSYLEEMEFEGASGVLVFAGGELLGLDLLPSPEVFDALKRKLLRSYALEGLMRMGKPTGFVSDRTVQSVLEEFNSLEYQEFPAVGEGRELRAEGQGLVARALGNGELWSFAGFRLQGLNQ